MKQGGIEYILQCGMFLGMAVASRFLLSLLVEVWAEILSLVLLLMIFSAMSNWLRGYTELIEVDRLSFRQHFGFVMKVFFVASLFLSATQYIVFEYARPIVFSEMLRTSVELLRKEQYPDELIKQAKTYLTTINYSVVTFFVEMVLGALMALVYWPIYKREQELIKPKKF